MQVEKVKKQKSTNQIIFDRVVKHFFKQVYPCFSDDGYYRSCRYRGAKGTACAVGCLISDKYYREGLEGQAVRYDKDVQRAVKRSLRKKFTEDTINLLGTLQSVHDTAYRSHIKLNSRSVFIDLEQCAVQYNLNTKAMDKYRAMVKEG